MGRTIEDWRGLGCAYPGRSGERGGGAGRRCVAQHHRSAPVEQLDAFRDSSTLTATASSGVTQVQYELTGGTLSEQVIATASTHHRRLGCRLEHHDRGERELHPRQRRVVSWRGHRHSSAGHHHGRQRPAEHHRGVPGERYHAGSNANSILRRRGISRCEPGHDRYLRSRRLIHCKHNANHLGLDRRSSRNSHPTGVVWTVRVSLIDAERRLIRGRGQWDECIGARNGR